MVPRLNTPTHACKCWSNMMMRPPRGAAVFRATTTDWPRDSVQPNHRNWVKSTTCMYHGDAIIEIIEPHSPMHVQGTTLALCQVCMGFFFFGGGGDSQEVHVPLTIVIIADL